jgi:hypothetical protein
MGKRPAYQQILYPQYCSGDRLTLCETRQRTYR